jgi:hypothetical protein
MTDDNFRDKIISLAKARETRANAEIDKAVEAEIRASEQFSKMLGNTMVGWLTTNAATFADDDVSDEVFIYGCRYFIELVINVLTEAFGSESAKEFAEKLRAAIKED